MVVINLAHADLYSHHVLLCVRSPQGCAFCGSAPCIPLRLRQKIWRGRASNEERQGALLVSEMKVGGEIST